MPIGTKSLYRPKASKVKATIKPFSSFVGNDRPTYPSSPSLPPKIQPPGTGGGHTNNMYAGGAGAVGAASIGAPPANAVPGQSSDGSSQYTGFMKQHFSPGGAGEIFQNPQMVLNALFKDDKQSTAGPMYSTLRDFYGADPQSLWFLTQGAKGGDDGRNALDANKYGNFLNSVYTNYETPGGRAFDWDEILANVMGLKDQSKTGFEDQSPLWQLLTSGGASEQANTLYGLLSDAARASQLAPGMQSASMDALRRQSDAYLTQNAQTEGGLPAFYKWMQNPMQGR